MKLFAKTLPAIFFCWTLPSFAQKSETKCTPTSTVITGTYKGKNLFIRNSEKDGIQEIRLDGKQVSAKPSTAFEVVLSQLKSGQKFELEIIYCTEAIDPFKILNPEVIK
jgi:hypothetical protein